MQTQPRYTFSKELFNSIRDKTPALKIVELERELTHCRNQIAGHKAFQTQLLKKIKNN